MRHFLALFILCTFAHGNTLTLPKPKGPHSVGIKRLEISDPTRTMFHGHQKKRWMITVFYPSLSHQDHSPYMMKTIEHGMVYGVEVLSFGKSEITPLNSKFPLIIFIPGRGNEREKYTILCEGLASQGYIVVSMDQPYVANFVHFPSHEKITLTLKDVWNLPRDRNYRYAYDDRAIDGAIGDISYLLGHMEILEKQGISCKKESIILMGHSLGGNVAHIMGFKDKRIRAVVDIDSKITERKIFGRVGVPPNTAGKPVLFIRGMMQYQEDVKDQLNSIKNATVWSPEVEHSAFSDDAYFSEKIPGYGQSHFLALAWNWLWKKGPHFSNIDTNLGGKKADDLFKEYLSYVTSWLNKQIAS